MQKNAKDLTGFTVQATDGRLGTVQDIYFDDRSWTIRYLKVLADGRDRHFLVPVPAFKQPHWEKREFDLNVTKERIGRGPGLDIDAPVTFDHELQLAQFYEWPVYPGPSHEVPTRGELSSPEMQTAVIDDELSERQLLGVNEVAGYRVLASGEGIGRLAGLVIDDIFWTVSYLAVDLDGAAGSGTILVGPDMIGDILTERSEVTTTLLKENVVPNATYREREFARVPLNAAPRPRRRGVKIRSRK